MERLPVGAAPPAGEGESGPQYGFATALGELLNRYGANQLCAISSRSQTR